MSEKRFNDMSLDEVFDLERQGSVHIGRSVVTAVGMVRWEEKKPAVGAGSTTGSYKLATVIRPKAESTGRQRLTANDLAKFTLRKNGSSWQLKKESSRRTVFISEGATQKEAIQAASRYLKNHGGGAVTIHNRDGSTKVERTLAGALSRGSVRR